MAKKIKTTEKEIPDITVNPTGVDLTDKSRVDITDEDKEEFFKCFISNTAFEQTSELFGGKIKVKFKSISVQENNDISRQVLADQSEGVASNSERYLTQITIYRLALSLQTIDGMPLEVKPITKETFTSDDENVTYVKAKADLFKDWPTFKLSAFLKSFLSFELKVFELEKAIADVNFWKAAE